METLPWSWPSHTEPLVLPLPLIISWHYELQGESSSANVWQFVGQIVQQLPPIAVHWSSLEVTRRDRWCV